MGASVGMMRMWSGNKTAKYLMPLLSKEKKRVAMDKVAQEAQEKGIEVPTILNDLDEKTGIPKLFNIQESAEGEEAPIELEQMVQKQIMLEEAADVPIIIMHEAECQTDAVETSDQIEQTTETVVVSSYSQTEEEKKESQEEEVQTDVEEGHHAETQTIVVEMVDAEVVTVVSTLLDALCQTEVLPTMDQISQTAQADLVDVEVATEIETKNIRVQTPCPVIEQKTIQTEDLEESRSTSKMSSARKRIRRAFAKQKPTRSLVDEKPTMSDWKDVDEEEIPDSEEEVSEESLHWDPVDGLHAEKQLPVSRLTQLFDGKITDRKKSKRKSLSADKKHHESPRARKSH